VAKIPKSTKAFVRFDCHPEQAFFAQ